MPIFTVTVQGPNGQTKIVTVNTDTMSAEVVPSSDKPNESLFASVDSSTNPFLEPESSVSESSVNQAQPTVQPTVQPIPHNFENGVDPFANNSANLESSPVTPIKKGGKRSTRIFRAKKKRTTRKLRR